VIKLVDIETLHAVMRGHHVPDAAIRRRFTRSLTNLFELNLPLTNNCAIFAHSNF
jgi:predicted ABC-type ATPase